MSLDERALRTAILALGVVPSTLLGSAELPPEIALLPPWATVFSSMFLHGGFMHLAGNMLYLWIFGDNIEHALGWKRFILFYAVCGVAAALTQALIDPASNIPMIGASGAISGVLGGYLLLYPQAKVRVLFFPFGIFGVPAMIVLGGWFVMQLLSGFGSSGGGGVAFWAHVGGFVAGMALIPFMKQADIPLFAKARHNAFYREPARHPEWRPEREPMQGPRARRQGPWGQHTDVAPKPKKKRDKGRIDPWNT